MAGRDTNPVHIVYVGGNEGDDYANEADYRKALGIATEGQDEDAERVYRYSSASTRCVVHKLPGGDRIAYIMPRKGGCLFDPAGIFINVIRVDDEGVRYKVLQRWDSDLLVFTDWVSVIDEKVRFSNNYPTGDSAGYEEDEWQVLNVRSSRFGSINPDVPLGEDPFIPDVEGPTNFCTFDYKSAQLGASQYDPNPLLWVGGDTIPEGKCFQYEGVNGFPGLIRSNKFAIGNREVQALEATNKDDWPFNFNTLGAIWFNPTALCIVSEDIAEVYDTTPVTQLKLKFGIHGYDVCAGTLATEPSKEYVLDIPVETYKTLVASPSMTAASNLYRVGCTQRIVWNTHVGSEGWVEMKGVFIWKQAVSVEQGNATNSEYDFYKDMIPNFRGTVVRTFEITVTKDPDNLGQYIFQVEQVHLGDSLICGLRPSDFDYILTNENQSNTNTFDVSGNYSSITSGSGNYNFPTYTAPSIEYVLAAGYYKGELNLVKVNGTFHYNILSGSYSDGNNYSVEYDGGAFRSQSRTITSSSNKSISTSAHIRIADSFDELYSKNVVESIGTSSASGTSSYTYGSDQSGSENITESRPDIVNRGMLFNLLNPTERSYIIEEIEFLQTYSLDHQVSGSDSSNAVCFGSGYEIALDRITTTLDLKYVREGIVQINDQLFSEMHKNDRADDVEDTVPLEICNTQAITEFPNHGDVYLGETCGGQDPPNYTCTASGTITYDPGCTHPDPEHVTCILSSESANSSHNEWYKYHNGFPVYSISCQPSASNKEWVDYSENPLEGLISPSLGVSLELQGDFGRESSQANVMPKSVEYAYNTVIGFRYLVTDKLNGTYETARYTEFHADLWMNNIARSDYDEGQNYQVLGLSTNIYGEVNSANGDTLISMGTFAKYDEDDFLIINNVRYPFNDASDLIALGIVTAEGTIDDLKKNFWGY